MKAYTQRLILGVTVFFVTALIGNAQTTTDSSAQKADFFPKGTFWVNSEFQFNMNFLKDKVTLIVVTDLNCVECGYYLNALQKDLFLETSVQVLQVVKSDELNPISRSQLIGYVQENKYTHPVGVVPDFSGFQNTKIDRVPFFMLYEKSISPTQVGKGQDGFSEISKRLKFLQEDKTLFKTCSQLQLRTVVEPTWWADPVIENPTYITNEEGGSDLFVIDAAHNRLLEMDQDGNMVRLIGSTLPGYLDDGIYTSLFNRPHGLAHSGGKLFVADTYNNRVRVVDFNMEKVTSLVGNGYITWKKAKEIDARYEPLGLPIDLAVLGNKLYIASATTNQIFEVDIEDGASRLLCDLPQGYTGLVRNCPINMNAGDNCLYVTMSDGQAYVVDRKGKINPVSKDQNYKFKSVCNWKKGVAGITADGKVMYGEEEKWNVVGETKVDGKVKNAVILNHPTDVLNDHGDLMITDTGNNFIREIGSPTDKLMKNYWLKLSQDLIGMVPAHTYGELVLMDSVYIAKDEIQMSVLLDLAGFTIVKEGQNELIIHDTQGKVKNESELITSENFTFDVKGDFEDSEIYMELYLTLEHPENPGLYIIKRAYLDFPVIVVAKADKKQEQIFRPNLLPY